MKGKLRFLTAFALGSLVVTGAGYQSGFAYNVYADTVSSAPVYAADMSQVGVPVTYRQSDARRILSLINSFRTGSDAWYIGQDNRTRIMASGLKALSYDYDLERAAMQRAAEIAISADSNHTRPDGTSCHTVLSEMGYNDLRTSGENYAIGYQASKDPLTNMLTAESAHTSFREDKENYSGQGHRRNMLESDYNCMGAACATYNGRTIWVEVFGRRDKINTASNSPVNSLKNVPVRLRNSDIKSVTLTPSVSSINIKANASTALPTITAKLTTKSIYNMLSGLGSYEFEGIVYPDYTWTSSNSSVASISGNTLKGMKAGNTNITATALGKSVSVPVSVQSSGGNDSGSDSGNSSINKCSASLTYEKCYYTGSARTPAVTVKDGNKTLVRNTDYSVKFENNVNAGTGRAIITGKGKYSGTVTKTFTIQPQAVGVFDITLNYSQCYYTGASRTPKVTVSNGAKTFKINTDYTTVYKNNTNAGTATVTITGKGNLTKSKTITFKILPQAIGTLKLGLSYSSCTYTGVGRTPAVVSKKEKISFGKDYITEYKNNINAGTASAIVQGRGNYTGKSTLTYKINPKNLNSKGINVSLNYSTCSFTGKGRTPAVTVMDGDKKLKLDGHYKVEYRNNVNKGTATVVITGIKNYTGTVTKTFTIK